MPKTKTTNTRAASIGKRSAAKSRASSTADTNDPTRNHKAVASKRQSAMSGSVEKRALAALDFAKSLAAKNVGWVTINNALFGPGGKLTQLFPNVSERAAVAGTPAFKQLCTLLDQERDDDTVGTAAQHPTASGQTIVRMPKSLHAALVAEAEAEGVSLNQLCVSKLSIQLRAAAASRGS